jgi:hypothetical protein
VTPPATQALLLAVFVVATSIWLGGYVAILVVSRVAMGLLDQPTRVEFFRVLGRKYYRVGTPALVVALVAGAVLARNSTGSRLYEASVLVSMVLVVAFAVAVHQARRMTRLRRDLVSMPADTLLTARIGREARAAWVLRAALGLLSVALVVLGSFLAAG